MANQKQIVIFSEDFPPYSGGVAQWASGIATGLHTLGNKVSVFTRERPELAEFSDEARPFPVRFIEGERWKQFRTWYCRRAIAKHFRSGNKPGIAIATTWNVARGIVSTTHRYDSNVVTVVHGLEVTRNMPKIKKMWLEKTLQNSELVVAVSEFTRQRVLEKYRIVPEKVIVLPNGVDTEKFYPGIDISQLRQRLGINNEKVILTLARVIERKGHDMVIKALPKVLKEIPNVKYVICGPWQQNFYEKLQKTVSGLGLRERVIFTGYVDPAELNAFYNLCDVYIMPSREVVDKGDTEGFGITYLEANACEKPVIGGKSGGVGDAIVDGQTGFLVEPEDVGEIGEKLILLLANPELSRRLGKQGRERVERNYTWQKLAAKLDAQLST